MKNVKPEVSERMRNQKINDTKPEIEIAKATFKLGLRYRKNVLIPEAKTTADLMLKKHNLIVFIDGCFWHGCPKHFKLPKTNTEWWDLKIQRNKKRDAQKTRILRKLGWNVIRLWEHVEPDKAAKKILVKTLKS